MRRGGKRGELTTDVMGYTCLTWGEPAPPGRTSTHRNPLSLCASRVDLLRTPTVPSTRRNGL
jgi:hypothetical protein